MFFLHLASEEGVTITAYQDDATAALIDTQKSARQIGDITLRPKVTTQTPLTEAAHMRLHDQAHAHCFIAASLTATIDIQPTLIPCAIHV